MRNVLAAVGRALAAMLVMVIVWCEQTGRFLLRCMPGYRPPDPEDLVQQYAEAVEAAPVTPKIDQRLQGIQTAADAMFRQEAVTGEMVSGLSPKTLAWLEALNADMLIAVARAKPADLREHLAGRKSIKGLLAADPDSVAAYVEAVKAEAAPEPKPAHTRKSRRQEQPFPAFGALC